MYPEYHYPARLILSIAGNLLAGRRRMFHDDACALANSLGGHLRFSGLENLEVSGPRVVTFNHYYRAGFEVWWLAAAVASCLPVHTHLVMTGELTHWWPPVGAQFSRWLLARAARMYGATSMPPMPPRPQDVAARAEAVRRVLRHVGSEQDPVVLLAPEGGDMPGGRLGWPPGGAGRFLLLLAGRGLRVLPAAGWEADGALYVRFGMGYRLDVPHHLSPDEKDRAAAGLVMSRIAALLPETLRGDFA